MTIIEIPTSFKERALLDEETYQAMYERSIQNSWDFWDEQAQRFIDFIKPYKTVFEGDIAHPSWFKEATLNVCYQCVDRHLPHRAEQTAIIWEGDELNLSRTITYQMLYDDVCRMANALKSLGIKKGDRVCIYLPMIVEAAVAMLACARIGAIHCVVFAGFSSQALQGRLEDSKSKLLITTNSAVRGGKKIPLYENAQKAFEQVESVEHVLVIDDENIPQHKKVTAWNDIKQQVSHDCPYEEMAAEDPLFILYTSGSTGKPKGILHTQAGYILYAAITHQYLFNYREGDIFWACADVGWVTGHTYIVYGPLANGATTVMFAGTPTYPNPSRLWQVVDKYQVTTFYTAPTVIRTLMREGTKPVQSTSRKSLKLLGSVGEPINPDVWLWYYNIVGRAQTPVCDTWWQTETGGVLLSPMPGAHSLKPGYAQKPFFGIEPYVKKNDVLTKSHVGKLCFKRPWPGMMRDIFNNSERYKTYFNDGMYISGDLAQVDADGDIQVIGRDDDVLNVSGHRIGSAEVENALCEHFDVAEAAVVGVNDDIKGEAIYAFVTLKRDSSPNDNLQSELNSLVAKQIGHFAKPQTIQWVKELPKTRSGKIMRRILRQIANGQTDNFGDLSTLAQPDVIKTLISELNTAEHI